MQTLERGKHNVHYLNRNEFQAIISMSKKDPITKEYSWAEKFKEGDVIHISESDGKSSVKIVERVLQIRNI